MKLRFLSGVEAPTGAMTLLEFEQFSVLFDCGLHQGRRPEARSRNLNFPFDPASLHSVVLSHAHPDACGNLPNLPKQGFQGMVFATMATQDLAGAALRDMALMQQGDSEHIAEDGDAGSEPREPIYSLEEAEQALYNFNGLNYNRPFHILRDLRCTFLDAGCILGSAIAVLEPLAETEPQGRIAYAGCLGSGNVAFLRPPMVPDEIENLILNVAGVNNDSEANIEANAARLIEAMAQTLHARGRVLIPGFGCGSPAGLMPLLREAWQRDMLPNVPVYVDSPLCVNIADTLRHHSSCYTNDVRARILSERDPFGFERMQCVRNGERLRELTDPRAEPHIVISPLATAESGHALRHLQAMAGNPDDLVVLLGTPPPDTLAQRLADGKREVSILGKTQSFQARVERFDALGTRAGVRRLTGFVQLVAEAGTLRRIFLTGTDTATRTELANGLVEASGAEVVIPEEGEAVDL